MLEITYGYKVRGRHYWDNYTRAEHLPYMQNEEIVREIVLDFEYKKNGAHYFRKG